MVSVRPGAIPCCSTFPYPLSTTKSNNELRPPLYIPQKAVHDSSMALRDLTTQLLLKCLFQLHLILSLGRAWVSILFSPSYKTSSGCVNTWSKLLTCPLVYILPFYSFAMCLKIRDTVTVRSTMFCFTVRKNPNKGGTSKAAPQWRGNKKYACHPPK